MSAWLARATTTDAFNAVAEASRRELLDAIGTGEVTVGELVDRVGLSQPQVSKHLGGAAGGRARARARRREAPLVPRQRSGAASRSTTGCARSSAPGTPVSTGSTTCSPSSNPRRKTCHEHHQQPPRLRRRHAAVRHRDRHHPAVRRPGRARLPGLHDARARQRWWGFDTSVWLVCEIDLRVGGTWRYVIRERREDFEVGFHGEYREIAAPHRLVSTEVFEGMPDAACARTPSMFDEVDGVTTMTMIVTHTCQEHRDGHIASGMEGGMQVSMDRLEDVVTGLAA